MKTILVIAIALSFNWVFATEPTQDYVETTKPLDEPLTKDSTNQSHSDLAKKIEGEYILSKKSNLDCLPEGKLTVTKDGDTETIMMGGHILAMGIGKDRKVIDKDINCDFTYQISYKGNIISGTDTKECDKTKITYHKRIEIQKDKLIIDKDAVENDKVVSKLNCVFNRVSNQPSDQSKIK